MATLHFSTTDKKIFSPISSALANLPNGAGTMILLFKKGTTATSWDGTALQASGEADIYHGIGQAGGPLKAWDDDGIVGVSSTASAPDDTTNWWWQTLDWAGGAAGLERMHWRNQTSGGTWTHSASTANNGGMRTGPSAATAWMVIGYSGNTGIARDQALVAVWAGTRFADSDYGTWTKTSDLYNHALGHPTFLCELNSSTPVDLIGGSTYSSANSTGTTLTGADPTGFTFDGLGTAAAPDLTMAPMR